MPRALILGAGISGLAAARRLRWEGFEVALLDTAERPGGMLKTVESSGFRADLGPTLVSDSEELHELAADAGCEEELISTSRSARRGFLVHGDRLVGLPTHPKDLVRSRLLSARGKLRLLAEPVQGRGPGPEESVADFFRRRFGSEAAESLAAALAVGIYGGDYRELAIGWAAPELYEAEREHGSLIQGMRKRPRDRRQGRPMGFRGGFGALAEALAEGLELHLETEVTSIEHGARGFRVSARQAGAERLFKADRVVSALPAAVAARLLAPFGDTSPWKALPHAPVAVLALAYERVAAAHDGFGFLVPPKESCPLLGCFFTSTLFPDTAPAGAVLLTASMGGRLRPELVEMDSDELAETAHRELRRLLGARGRPEVVALERWRPGIPQPTATMAGVDRAVAALRSSVSGLEIVGNWVGGPSVGDCLRTVWRP